METWALANQKGGTGKTTTAINLAAALSSRGKRVLLVDLDPQAHATLGLGVSAEGGPSIADVFLSGAPLGPLVQTHPSGFHLVPAEVRLAEFEELAERSLRPEGLLKRALAELESRFDWVLLDCPPRADGILTINAIRAATTTLLVVETGAFALQGALRARGIFEASWNELQEFDQGLDDAEFDLRLMATMFDPEQETAREFLIALQARFGEIMLDTVVRRAEVLRRAVAYGVPAETLEPDSSAVRDFVALSGDVLLHATTRRSAGRITPAPLPSEFEPGVPWMP